MGAIHGAVDVRHRMERAPQAGRPQRTAPGSVQMRLLRRFLCDTFGQDVIEYALLAAFIGCLGAAAWAGVKTGIGTRYGNWDSCSPPVRAAQPVRL
jgi:Flp pilus assembly pilin Flp